MAVIFGILFVVALFLMFVFFLMGLNELNEPGLSTGIFFGFIAVIITGIFYYNLALLTMFNSFVNDEYTYKELANCKIVIKNNDKVVYRVCNAVDRIPSKE
jgi:uncharacterized membrane protein